MKTPWAILLTKFSDTPDDPYPRSRYEEIFTSVDSGKWSIPDYFKDMSHGKLDLSGSKVFGWHTLDKNVGEYTGSGANPQGRRDLITWARDKATAEGVELADFTNIVVVLNVGADLFGGPKGVVCGDDGRLLAMTGLSASYLGQEMGHGYGLNHSRRDGSQADYQDRFDVMSVANAEMSDHPVYQERMTTTGEHVFRIGPGLNAANMDAMGWLDETRVWSSASGRRVNTTLQLRPLHRRDLPGFLAARFGDYLIEFRMNEGWDAAFGPAVLVHYFEDGASYIVPNDDGDLLWTQGTGLTPPAPLTEAGFGVWIKVVEINAETRTATLQLARSIPHFPREWPKQGPYQTPWIKWSDLIADDQALVVVGGNAFVVNPSSPSHTILRSVAMMEALTVDMPLDARQAVRLAAMSRIREIARADETFKSPAVQPGRADR